MVIPLAIIGAILLAALVWAVANYNRMARQRQHIRKAGPTSTWS